MWIHEETYRLSFRSKKDQWVRWDHHQFYQQWNFNQNKVRNWVNYTLNESWGTSRWRRSSKERKRNKGCWVLNQAFKSTNQGENSGIKSLQPKNQRIRLKNPFSLFETFIKRYQIDQWHQTSASYSLKCQKV